MSKKATFKQLQVLAYVDAYTKKWGFAPTRDEIANYFEVYPSAVSDRLKHLLKKDMVFRAKHKNRGWFLTENGIKELENATQE